MGNDDAACSSGAGAVKAELRAAAARALREIVDDGAPATRVVPRLLRGVTSNSERVALKDAVFGAAVLRLRLRFLYGADIDRWIDDPRGSDDDGVDWPRDLFERLEVQHSCPRWLVHRLVHSLGEAGTEAFLAASNRPGPVTLRANTLRNSRAQLRERLHTEGVVVTDNVLSPDAVDVVGRANLTGLGAWRHGCFEVQDAGSQLIAQSCGVKAGDVVVDLCAGRGGKTLALAALMNDVGTLHINDVDAGALADLRGRLGRAGVTCVQAGLPVDGGADVVLVDAPCSALGVLRRSPDLRFTLQKNDIDDVTMVQRSLLARAAQLVRPQGRVVYATCSVLREENEDVVNADAHGLSIETSQTLLPHVHGCDGFFICSLRRPKPPRG